jgi:hypothetical protein
MPKKVDYTSLFILLFSTFLGGFIRISLTAQAGFPLNDGGMFHTMTREIIEQRFALPDFTAYNGYSIPFFYPPLSFYLAAVLAKLTPLTLLALLQYLPAVLSTLTIPAFFRLSLTFTESKSQAAFATLAFSFLPRAYVWLIMGGGLSRSLGFLFAILALEQLLALFKRQNIRNLPGAALFSALTILSHPEVSWFLFCSAALAGLWYGRSRAGIRHALLVVAGAFILILPWLLTVLLKHGASPLLAAFQVRNDSSLPLIQLILFTYTEEAFTDILGTLAFLGFFNELFRKRFFLPAWVALTVFLTLRNAPYILMLQVTLLAGIGLDQVVLPGITRQGQISKTSIKEWFETKTGAAFCTILLVYLLFSAISFSFLKNTSLRALPASEREAMAWIAANTPKESKFILLTGEPSWEIDQTSEWFPALAGRISLATVQGTEWLPGEIYPKTQESYRRLQACAQKDAGCLQAWEEQAGQAFTHLYLRKTQPEGSACCLNILIDALAASPGYQLIYEGTGAVVFTVRAGQE